MNKTTTPWIGAAAVGAVLAAGCAGYDTGRGGDALTGERGSVPRQAGGNGPEKFGGKFGTLSGNRMFFHLAQTRSICNDTNGLYKNAKLCEMV